MVQISSSLVESSSQDPRALHTGLNYWDAPPQVPITIDFTQPDGQQKLAETEKLQRLYPVTIHDVRGHEKEYTLDTHGFQYVRNEVPELQGDDWSDQTKVVEVLIPKSEELVRQMTGAKDVVTFTHRIRCFASDEEKLANNRSPAHSVHLDFTVTGGLKHLETVLQDTARVKQALQGRVLVINVWRPLKTIKRDPLAVCDWNSVKWDEDFIPYRMLFPHGWNELAKVRFVERHRWYYLEGQQPSEPLVFKQFDSGKKDEGGWTLPHSAFEIPGMNVGEPRESLEIKMFAFFD